MRVADGTHGCWLRAIRVYLAVVAFANLGWESLHLPLYAVWSTGTGREKVFAVVHCAGGDVLIALTALMLALLLVGTPTWPAQRFAAVAGLAILFGVAYTVFSEWFNVYVRGSWTYSDWMPIARIGDKAIGLSPIAQWIVVPSVAFAALRLRRPH